MKTRKIKGKHFIFDLYGCDYHELDSPAHLEKVMRDAATAAHMEILNVHFHKFSPHGVTGMLLLSTSHISVHTWPEYGYAAFDVFSCSDEAQTKLAVNSITAHMQHSRKRIQGVDRGYAELKTISVPIYKNGTKREIKVHKKLAEIESSFQRIQVLDLEEFGRTLLIDGITQVSEDDHLMYDDAILKPMREGDTNVLVLGGGDGYVAQRILEKNPRAMVTVVELDSEVIYCARTYFGQSTVFEDPRVNLIIGDAIQYLKVAEERGERFDGIVIDLTDNPVGSGRALSKLRNFYETFLKHAISLLDSSGWISSQAGVPKAIPPYTTTYQVLRPLFEETLTNVTETRENIPSFLEQNVFLHGTKK